MSKLERIVDAINLRLNGGECPGSGSFGECPAADSEMPGRYWAAVCLWGDKFNDSTKLAGWFHELGAESVTVNHTLYSDDNEDRDGKCTVDGVRTWNVYFSIPEEQDGHKVIDQRAS